MAKVLSDRYKQVLAAFRNSRASLDDAPIQNDSSTWERWLGEVSTTETTETAGTKQPQESVIPLLVEQPLSLYSHQIGYELFGDMMLSVTLTEEQLASIDDDYVNAFENFQQVNASLDEAPLWNDKATWNNWLLSPGLLILERQDTIEPIYHDDHEISFERLCLDLYTDIM